jgi:hypothetical protein
MFKKLKILLIFTRETGVGSTSPIGSSKENDSNKTETLRLLLAFISKSMYMSGGI